MGEMAEKDIINGFKLKKKLQPMYLSMHPRKLRFLVKATAKLKDDVEDI